jgi:hypothetical protein
MAAKKQARTLAQTQLRIRAQLQKRFQHLEPVQKEDLATAYHTALKLTDTFSKMVEDFTTQVNNQDLECKCRPGNGVKNPARILEKAYGEPIPLDFLGGKIIAPTLKRIYDIAQKVPEHFKICGFKDRFETPQSSGYMDLQFQVELGTGHIAELKIVHQAMDELDAIEHRIYEIVRMLVAKEMNESETKVYRSLRETSQSLYTEVWESILKTEVKK